MTLEGEGNVDGDWLVFADGEEVDVEALVTDGVELKLVENCSVGLPVGEGEVDDEGCGGVKETLEILGRNGEKNILDAASVEVARDETFPAEGFDDGFVAFFADGSAESEMLHCFLFKMCYSVRAHPGPHCTKSPSAFKERAKIGKNFYLTRDTASFQEMLLR